METTRQRLVNSTVNKLRVWGNRYAGYVVEKNEAGEFVSRSQPVGTPENPLVMGIERDDLRMSSTGWLYIDPKSHAVAIAVSAIVDGAKPGTLGSEMLALVNRWEDEPSNAWKRFKAEVIRKARQ